MMTSDELIRRLKLGGFNARPPQIYNIMPKHIVPEEPTQYCNTCGWTGPEEETQFRLEWPEVGDVKMCPHCHNTDVENLDDED